MKRNYLLLILTGIVLIIVICIIILNKKNVLNVQIDYGKSSIYSKEDMDEAIRLILNEFNTWNGCKLHKIYYSSDEISNNESNIKWMNDLEEANDKKEYFKDCIMFFSDFHSPKKGGGAWNEDSEYNQWQWWLARGDNGNWKLMTWGY